MEFAPDGRIFIAEKGSGIRIIKNGSLLQAPFVSLNVDSRGERGVLGITLDPNFSQNQYAYVFYTAETPSKHNRVSRFTASGDVALSGSEIILLEMDNLSQAFNHNAGAIHFGPDGKLYFTTGDNGSPTNSQNLGNDFGKILRINSDGTIPTDNPYYGQSGKKWTIWANGLRNPFTFNLDLQNGKIFINDVGANNWEEINELVKGGNYGWPNCEGTCSLPGYINPVYTYDHSVGHAITGASFYRANQFPSEYSGDYFFGDYVYNWIKRLDPVTGTVTNFAAGTDSPVDIDVGLDGSLYYISIAQGSVYKISYGASPTPPPFPSPSPTPPPDQLPTASIPTPAENSFFNAADTVSYSGDGSDPQDGTLGDSAFSWTIVFHHGTHTHPFLGPIEGVKSGSFEIPQVGEPAADTWYRIHLTVTDSNGYTNETTRDIFLNKANITLDTSPAGLQVTLDGQPHTAPYTEQGIVNFIRTMGAPFHQTLNGKSYEFLFWSDGGAINHDINTPSTDTTYTAVYQEITAPVGNGNGVTGTYFGTQTLTGKKVTRIDPIVNFNWGTGIPISGIKADNFSVRWTGQILPQFTETYTFYTRTNEGLRLWVNNQLIIDHWQTQPATEWSGQIELTAGQQVTIKMEYFENKNKASAELRWSSPATPKQIIPQSQLFSI